ncbi:MULTISPECIES: hypothetical protein [Acinetobacter]|uniref:Uncharacterized protein n=1 Tax=Acinetobacter piscicola TaxID=2006115 RepID=A0A7S6VU63_9GAMM|nr:MULTISPECIES: hypothetical protein [Acinetobacter]MDM1758259.1 hypothetical protein [Acinetobacter sp. 256-1]MDM1760954.1 hypothetical protein [Acinetobacter sp. 251-1]QOW44936.1 hypothetical protein G0028_02920 [Acinetobacter piscicola]
MPSLLSKIAQRIQRIYQKAGDFIEEEREFPISQVFLNATFQRFVTDNVEILEDLHADLHNDWLRLYATLNVKGMHLVLGVDLKLIQMEFNKDMQLIVFEQISNTEVIEATYPNFFYKLGVNAALFFYQKILKKDPLGMILEKFNVLTVKDELLHLDLNRWLGDKRSIMDTLNKVHINHAELRETELVVIGNVNLMALFNKVGSNDWDDDSAEDDFIETDVTPIQQK